MNRFASRHPEDWEDRIEEMGGVVPDDGLRQDHGLSEPELSMGGPEPENMPHPDQEEYAEPVELRRLDSGLTRRLVGQAVQLERAALGIRKALRAAERVEETLATITTPLAFAYGEQRDEIGDSDLDGEQPVTLTISTTLAVCRKARSVALAPYQAGRGKRAERMSELARREQHGE